MSLAVETRGLTKYYGRRLGVTDLDLEVGEGEVFGFLGPNGAGKTTTLRLLLDLIRPTRGSLKVLGLDPRTRGVDLRRLVGYVPGELDLYGRLTGEELLRYFAALRGGVDRSWTAELAERFEAELGRRISRLSTGNRRKLALIQAFMHRPRLLVLDEPTSGLDPLMQHVFGDLLAEARAAGQTVLLSSHLLPEVQELCGRAAFVREGRLVAVEDVAALARRAARDVEVVLGGEGGSAALAAALATVPGVSDVRADGRRLRLRLGGRADPLVKELARHDVETFTSAEPDLEDLFMSYYGGHGEPDGEPDGPPEGERGGRPPEGADTLVAPAKERRRGQ